MKRRERGRARRPLQSPSPPPGPGRQRGERRIADWSSPQGVRETLSLATSHGVWTYHVNISEPTSVALRRALLFGLPTRRPKTLRKPNFPNYTRTRVDKTMVVILASTPPLMTRQGELRLLPSHAIVASLARGRRHFTVCVHEYAWFHLGETEIIEMPEPEVGDQRRLIGRRYPTLVIAAQNAHIAAFGRAI